MTHRRWNRTSWRKGAGVVQPLVPHEHWHIDISDVNVLDTFCDGGSILDVATRVAIDGELRERMVTAVMMVIALHETRTPALTAETEWRAPKLAHLLAGTQLSTAPLVTHRNPSQSLGPCVAPGVFYWSHPKEAARHD